jgi:ABC-2 type transport system permease protein
MAAEFTQATQRAQPQQRLQCLKRGSFFWQYVKLNFLASWEYRASFFSQMLGMILNDVIWLIFWSLFFSRFPAVNGWGVQDVIMLWAIVALAFGVASGIFGNSMMISDIVQKGQLDYYLTIPRNVLWHVLISKIRPTAIGDFLFGIAVFLIFGGPTPARLTIFTIVAICSAATQLGFFVMAQSLCFYIDRSDVLSQQASMGLIHFSTYPVSIFERWVKVCLYTLIPAAFVTGIPVELLKHFRWPLLGVLVAGSALYLTLAILMFNRGLRRYSSGNLLEMRS